MICGGGDGRLVFLMRGIQSTNLVTEANETPLAERF